MTSGHCQSRQCGIVAAAVEQHALGHALLRARAREMRPISCTVAGLVRYPGMRQRLALGLTVNVENQRIRVCTSDFWRCWGYGRNYTENDIHNALQLHAFTTKGHCATTSAATL